MTIYENILLERKGKVTTLKINKPPLNLLNTPLLQEIIKGLQSIKEDKGCRILVLTGKSDNVFIGGADMNEMKNLNPQTAKDFITLLHTFMKLLRLLPIPVIGRISGFALGAGC